MPLQQIRSLPRPAILCALTLLVILGPSTGALREKVPDVVRVLARYADKDLLMSGWINGERRIAGKAAAVEVSVGRGAVVLYGFGITFRGQPLGTFKLLFNPIMEAGARAAAGSHD